jgi:hypothetical protein
VKKPQKPQSQSDKFKAMAKELDTDNAEGSFNRKLKALAKYGPKRKASAQK